MVIWNTIRNPLFGAAAVCAVTMYCFGIPVRNRNPFRSFVPLHKAVFMEGRITSDPVKSSVTGKYTARFRPCFIRASDGTAGTCSGEIPVLLDSSMVEAYLPGKLYSQSRNTGALICERGASAGLYGKTIAEGVFLANKGYPLGFSGSVWGKIAHFRAQCRLRFCRLMYAWGDAGGLLLALLSGVREYTGDGMAEVFKKAGLSYILALSGMHLSICSGIAATTGSFIFGKRTSVFFRICAVLLFVWFAGLSPSLLRAVLCCAIVTAASLCGVTNVNMFLVLCMAFLCQICISPADCRSAAFMLSYSALAGILFLSEHIYRRLVWIVPGPVSAGLASSVAAQTVTAPVTLCLFGTFMPGGIAAAVVVSPLIVLFMYAGLLSVAFCLLFPFFAGYAGIVLNALFLVIKTTVTAFSTVPAILIHHILY